MPPIHYWNTDEEVRPGDIVAFSRLLRRTRRGTVTSVFQSDAPARRELNDYGISVALDDGSEVWFGAAPSDAQMPRNLKLLTRSQDAQFA